MNEMPQSKSTSTVRLLKHRQPEHFLVSSGQLSQSPDLRLDASYYRPDSATSVTLLQQSGMQIQSLESLSNKIFLPPRFKRIYVDDDYGVPFLNGTNIIQFQPSDIKNISPESCKKFEDLIIRKGWLLLTRSGTVGRVVLCPEEWDGWAASEHIIRIVPDETKCPSGYLCAFLTSKLGQEQLISKIYGAVVDEITAQQVRDLLIPLPNNAQDTALVQSIDTQMKESTRLRTVGVRLAETAITQMEERFES